MRVLSNGLKAYRGQVEVEVEVGGKVRRTKE
jgi:hypothetical protein